MIIFGTKGITSIQKQGTFHCPACGAGANYTQKEVRRYFTLFFVPLIPLHKVAEYVECQRCGGSFKPEVLTWNGTVPSSTPPPLGPVAAASIRAGMPPAIPGMNPGSATTVSYQANGLAKASMILGIVGLLTSFVLCPSILFLLPALVMGIVGLNRAKNGNGLVGGKKAAIAGITCSIIGLVAMVAIPVLVLNTKGEPGKKSPRSAAASKVSGSSDETAYGNSPKAQELAEKYAAAMQLMHAVSFSSKKSSSSRSTRYVVHCELQEGTCAFLAYVPDYRKFDDDAKDALNNVAWSTAQDVLKADGTLKPDTKLCVALKGLVMFGSVMTGEATGAPQTNGKDETDMDLFFPELAEPSATPRGNVPVKNEPEADRE